MVLYETLSGESNLACAVVGCAALEAVVRSLLSKFLVAGKTAETIICDPKGPFASFRSMAEIAYCSGLITEPVLKNLRLVADVRNAFAHSPTPVTFADEGVIKNCNKMTFPIFTDRDGNLLKVNLLELLVAKPIDRFILVVSQLHTTLLMSAHTTERRDHSKAALWTVIHPNRPGPERTHGK